MHARHALFPRSAQGSRSEHPVCVAEGARACCVPGGGVTHPSTPQRPAGAHEGSEAALDAAAAPAASPANPSSTATHLVQQQLQLMVAQTVDYAIITIDLAGRVVSWNPGAEHIFGFSAEEMVGKSCDHFFVPEDRSAGVPQKELARAREFGRAHDDRWHLRKDGSRVYCHGIMMPLNDGGLVGYAKIARDLTRDKRVADEREALLVTEKELRAELQRASSMKDEFLAVMSHELKHPLNLIHLNAELLMRLPQVREAADVQRAVDVIRRTVLNQAKIIEDLLDLSRIRTGKLSLNPVEVDWVAIIERILESAKSDARVKQVTLVTELDPRAARVLADPLRVEQIVWNLLSNALKFTPAGGQVRLCLAVEDGMSRLDVEDNGAGIDPTFIEHLFEMFRQPATRATRPHGGLGIGLALVKQLVKLQGGRVTAHSDGIGRGARLSVWLPRSIAPPQRGAEGQREEVLRGLRVLLVDDLEDALESFAMVLRLEGAQATTCSSAAQALRAAQEADFDLLLSDVDMPGMDGYEFLARLRRGSRNRHVRAIALTGYARLEDRRRAAEAGFDAHLTKPVSVRELTETIARLLPAGSSG